MKENRTDSKKIPDPVKETAEWYQEVVSRAGLADHSPVKGCMVIRPYGFAIWELLRDELDRRLKARGVQNAYFPIFIPMSYLAREKAHIKGFSPECAVVTHAGGQDLEEPLIVRPTSETIIHESMARWINSYRDLPLRINQWANVVRWEKRPRLFLRTTEFLWQEGHTAHVTEDEARVEVDEMLNLYRSFIAEVLAIPTVMGVKSDQEKFAGAVESSSVEGLMPDGKGLQMGTAHYLGENFSKIADVGYLSTLGKREYVQMTSWGVSTRLIGALIMVHGDSRGIVLPPAIAPIQVVIIPIGFEKDQTGVDNAVANIASALRGLKLRVEIDARKDLTPGAKFYHWEVRGVPLRIEIGPRDIKNGKITIAWRTSVGKKESFDQSCVENIPIMLEDCQAALLKAAENALNSRTIAVENRDEFVSRLEAQDGFIRVGWCGSDSCENAIKHQTGATIRNLPHKECGSQNCIWCGSAGKHIAYFAKAY
ncbi:MAG: proline--tRNA ligase [bacterium]|nr:proline--tRNA ligase [bacterium]